jgi:hypothetical protein
MRYRERSLRPIERAPHRLATLAAGALLAITALAAIRIVVLAARDVPTSYPALVIRYDVGPALIAVGAIAALFARPARRATLAASVGAGVLALYVVEAAIWHGKGSYVASLHATRPSGLTAWDDRTQVAVVTDFRARGVPAYSSVERGALESASRAADTPGAPYPLAGVANTFTVFCNENGEYTNYVSDRHGFNNPSSVWDQPGLVALIGDSFVHGRCVDTSATLAAQIRRVRPAISLGTSGNGPLSELAILREYAAPLTPRRVAWLYFAGNDFVDFQSERSGGFLDRYRRPGFRQSLIDRQSEVDALLRAYLDRETTRTLARARDHWWYDAKAFLTLRGIRERVFPVLFGDQHRMAGIPCATDRFEQFVDLMAQARAEVQHWGGQFYFVYLATWPDAQHLPSCQPAHDTLIRALDGRGIPVIDLEARFSADANPRRFWQAPYFPTHLNPAGYAEAARAILERFAVDSARGSSSTH